MAQIRGNFKVASVQVSVDGNNWMDITDSVIGSIYILPEDSDDLTEITPDNPIYAELLEILSNSPNL